MWRIFTLIAVLWAGAANAQLGAGSVSGSSGGGGGLLCSQGIAFLARTSGETSNYNAVVMNLICGIVADGNWSLMDGFFFFPAANSTDALKNLVSTSYTGVVNGTCTFTANVGYTGDASSCYIDPSFDPSVGGVNFLYNNASLGAYVLNNRTTVQTWVDIGVGTVAGITSYIAPYQTTGNDLTSINSVGYNGTSTTSQGQYVSTQVSGNLALYKNSSATPTGTSTATSPTFPPSNLEIFASLNVTRMFFSGDQVSVVWWGGPTTSTQAAAIMTRVNTAMCSLTSPINVYTC